MASPSTMAPARIPWRRLLCILYPWMVSKSELTLLFDSLTSVATNTSCAMAQWKPIKEVVQHLAFRSYESDMTRERFPDSALCLYHGPRDRIQYLYRTLMSAAGQGCHGLFVWSVPQLLI
ncbi:hypothetical protein F4820DRAFT_362702 [Hypoxylon rubiginosum]|uniref:Uncharacterized protein n=1 Tax=Hypoxylon rubiginosum TaxID=110542 RepID=A0ACB9YWE0_9PEZI|nr:hypothetical protein F4820DRAFT_362702 [Hypoxylon rubiginosum]